MATIKAEEKNRMLKDRLSRLKHESGSSGGGSSSSSSRKSDGHASGDASRIQSLQLLVNCKICETNQKDRVITKCMHTLCQYCVKANLEVRTHAHARRHDKPTRKSLVTLSSLLWPVIVLC